MAATVFKGTVVATSGEGTDLAALIGEADSTPAGNVAVYSASINVPTPELETTFASGSSLNARTYTSGLATWTGTMNARWPKGAASQGLSALITMASAYDVNVRDYTLTINGGALDATNFDDSPAGWRTFIPGLLDWTLSYNAFMDSSSSITLGSAGASSESATIKLLEDGTSDASFTGSGIVTAVATGHQVGELNTVAYTVRGTGDLTSVAGTDNSYVILPAGTLDAFEETEIVVTASSGKTLTGTCFITSLGISVQKGVMTDVSIAVQGTGAVTVA